MSMLLSVLMAAVFIPQGSEDQVLMSPLSRGETAYVNGGSGEAYVYVGDQERARRVVDESALRGYEYGYLDRSEFVVLAVSNLTRDVSSDSLVFRSYNPAVTNSYVFSVTVPHGIKFDDVEFDVVKEMPIGTGPVKSIVKSTAGNVVTVTIHDVSGYGVSLTVNNFAVKSIKYGDPDYVNDLTVKKIRIHDSASEDRSLGHVYDSFLGDWRRQVLHYYDGNRGKDWSRYNASNNVEMTRFGIDFGYSNKGLWTYSLRQDRNDTNSVVSTVFGDNAVKYYTTQDTSGATFLKFTSIDNGYDNVTFTLVVSNAAFNASLLKLYESPKIALNESDWRQIPYTLVSSSPITIRAAKTFTDQAYYMLKYGNSHVVVHVCDTLKVDRLLLKGDNGSYYRIGVNASGVLTASPATE